MAGAVIEVLRETTPEVVSDLARLLPQVSSSAPALTRERLEAVVSSSSSEVFVAREAGRVVGMALLVVLSKLAGRSGHVEEVAVESSARGQHISTRLMEALLKRAVEIGLDYVDLTTRPSRAAANGLYRSVGFVLRDTNCYRHDLQVISAELRP